MSGLAGQHLAGLAMVLCTYLATALAAAVLHRRTLAFVYPLCLVAALGACVVNLVALLGGTDMRAQLPLGLPSVGLRFHLDGLSAFFGLIVNLGIVTASSTAWASTASSGRAASSRFLRRLRPP